MQNYKILIPVMLLADKTTKVVQDDIVPMDPADEYTQMMLANGFVELVPADVPLVVPPAVDSPIPPGAQTPSAPQTTEPNPPASTDEAVAAQAAADKAAADEAAATQAAADKAAADQVAADKVAADAAAAKAAQPPAPVPEKKKRKFYRNHEVLAESPKRVGGVQYVHVRLGNGTEMDLSPDDYARDVRVSNLDV